MFTSTKNGFVMPLNSSTVGVSAGKYSCPLHLCYYLMYNSCMTDCRGVRPAEGERWGGRGGGRGGGGGREREVEAEGGRGGMAPSM